MLDAIRGFASYLQDPALNLSNLVGVLIGAWIARRVTKKSDQTKIQYDLRLSQLQAAIRLHRELQNIKDKTWGPGTRTVEHDENGKLISPWPAILGERGKEAFWIISDAELFSFDKTVCDLIDKLWDIWNMGSQCIELRSEAELAKIQEMNIMDKQLDSYRWHQSMIDCAQRIKQESRQLLADMGDYPRKQRPGLAKRSGVLRIALKKRWK